MSDKYSVLFMRDDTRVRRFRISPFWLRMLIWLQVLTVCTAAAGMYAGYSFWQKNEALLTERVTLQRQLRETQVHLERLENMEQILKSNDPEELQSLFGNMSIEESTRTQPPIDLKAMLKEEDARLVQVSNVTLKPSNDQNLRLTFDLNNLNTKKAVNGQGALVFITREGRLVPIEVDVNDLKFQISRFKKVVTTLTLPEGTTLRDIFALRIEILSDDNTILRDVFPLSTILQ